MCSDQTRSGFDQTAAGEAGAEGGEKLPEAAAEQPAWVLIKHGPVLVSVKDYIKDDFNFWYFVDHCWMQNLWYASVNPKGAFFCEVAAAMDVTFNGPGGWPIEPGWWKKRQRIL